LLGFDKVKRASRRRAVAYSSAPRRETGPVYYVYILRSESSSKQTYIGSTHDLRTRLAQHNSGKSIHTNKFKPWKISVYVAFQEKELAEKFEKYLKTGSGRVFSSRHLIS
jgi:putative endonuclease